MCRVRAGIGGGGDDGSSSGEAARRNDSPEEEEEEVVLMRVDLWFIGMSTDCSSVALGSVHCCCCCCRRLMSDAAFAAAAVVDDGGRSSSFCSSDLAPSVPGNCSWKSNCPLVARSSVSAGFAVMRKPPVPPPPVPPLRPEEPLCLPCAVYRKWKRNGKSKEKR